MLKGKNSRQRQESTGQIHRFSFVVLESNYGHAMGSKAGRIGRVDSTNFIKSNNDLT